MSSRPTSEGPALQSSTIQHERVATGLSYDQLVHAFERERRHRRHTHPLMGSHSSVGCK